jgi:hypothetical protein
MDVVPVAQPNAPLQGNALGLHEDACGYGYYGEPIVHDGTLLLPRQSYDYALNASIVSLSAFDVNGASGPSLIREVALPQSENSYNSAVWLEANDALVALQISETWDWVSTPNGADGGAPINEGVAAPSTPMQVPSPGLAAAPVSTQGNDSNVVVSEAPAGDAGVADVWSGGNSGGYDYGYWNNGYSRYTRSARLSVVDLRDVASSMAVTTLDVPQDWVDNGFARGSNDVSVSYASPKAGAYGMVAGGDIVASQHRVLQEDGIRYYIDRLDVSNPTTPNWLPPANIPGAVVSLAQDDIQLVTVDEVALPLSEAECVQGNYNDFVVCYNRAVELSALTLETNRAVRTKQVRLGTSRQWFTLAIDEAAVYVGTNATADVRAYSPELDALGQFSVEDRSDGSLTVIAGHAAGYEYGPSGYRLYSTSGNALHSLGFINLSENGWCGNWAVYGTEAYCGDGYDGVVHTTLE